MKINYRKYYIRILLYISKNMDERDVMLAKNGDEEAMEKVFLRYKSDILRNSKNFFIKDVNLDDLVQYAKPSVNFYSPEDILIGKELLEEPSKKIDNAIQRVRKKFLGIYLNILGINKILKDERENLSSFLFTNFLLKLWYNIKK